MVFQLCSTPIALTEPLDLSAVAVISKSIGMQSLSQSLGLAAFTVITNRTVLVAYSVLFYFFSAVP